VAQKVIIDPITRIEGHLAIEVEVENGKVTDAHVAGEMFRGFEQILRGRSPLDAPQITQRICGVCPSSHGQAAILNLDAAFGVQVPDNGRIIRNLMLGANYVQSHILHFYHLTALDFVDITAVLKYNGKDRRLNQIKEWAAGEAASKRWNALAPFMPRMKGDYIQDTDLNLTAIAHFVDALDMRRKAQEALALWGGKMPHEIAIFPGGVSEKPTVDKIVTYLSYMKELKHFVETAYIPDVIAVAKAYAPYFKVGKGCGNLLSFGVFEEDNGGKNKLLGAGVYLNGKAMAFDEAKIGEYVGYSKFSSASGSHPYDGETVADADKSGAYTWLKAPRYEGAVCEVGPLARMAVAYLTGNNKQAKKLVGDTLKALNLQTSDLFSPLGRHAARALEAKLVADACIDWVQKLQPGKPVHTPYKIPAVAKGVGLTEAPRGALGHWIRIKDQKIENYQCVVPTTWNCSPRDDKGVMGPIEQALIGCPVADTENPIEPCRLVRSFDPCIACAVHVVNGKGEKLSQFKVL
jgi:Ni,Fe-hydrogenase I large subunit